mgnify:CR=1 FL=1
MVKGTIQFIEGKKFYRVRSVHGNFMDALQGIIGSEVYDRIFDVGKEVDGHFLIREFEVNCRGECENEEIVSVAHSHSEALNRVREKALEYAYQRAEKYDLDFFNDPRKSEEKLDKLVSS